MRKSRSLGVVLALALLLTATGALAAPQLGGTFSDDNGHIFEGVIEAIAAEGITQGCNPPVNDRFCPDDFVTRGQMAVFLVRGFGYANNGGGDLFVDDDGSFYENAADRLRTAGVTLGCNPPINNRYCGVGLVTRGQMAAFLVRALELTDDGGGNLFIDDDGSVFEAAIDRLGTAGITQGCNPPTNDRFCPDARVTRGQMAAFLSRALNLDPPTSAPTDPPTSAPTDPPTSAPTDPPTSAPTEQFPNPDNSGVPTGWTPTATRSTDLTVTQAGAVVENIRFADGADLVVSAANVTVRRVEFQGGSIYNWPGATCYNGLVIEDTSFVRLEGQPSAGYPDGAVGVGGYTARGVSIEDYSEGFRVGGNPDCGPAVIENSYVGIVPPQPCGDWHGDGIQGFHGGALTVRNVTIDFDDTGCGGTAPFFYPSGQGNTSVNIDRLLVKGGGYSFRNGMPGTVKGLRIVDGSWYYGPIDVKCSAITSWEAAIVTIDTAYRARTVRAQPCNSNGGA